MNEETHGALTPVGMNQAEFLLLSGILGAHLGFRFPDNKQAMLAGRLAGRMRALRLESYLDYAGLLQKDAAELQTAVNLVTTNETRFFREPEHFDFLEKNILPSMKAKGIAARFWSAACSSGQEPYSLAMTLQDALGPAFNWQIWATDISEKVLAKAQRGLYPIEESQLIPPQKLKAHCLRGNDEYEGWFLINRALRERIHFQSLNLMSSFPDELNNFDVIFLRNVMIYFEQDRKEKLISEIRKRLNPSGILIIGQAESIHAGPSGFKQLRPSIYQKV